MGIFLENDESKITTATSPKTTERPTPKISIAGSIVIASIVLGLALLMTQTLKQESIEKQQSLEFEYKQSLSQPYEDCLKNAETSRDAAVSTYQYMYNDEVEMCSKYNSCRRTYEAMMDDLSNAIDQADKEMEIAQQKCIDLYK